MNKEKIVAKALVEKTLIFLKNLGITVKTPWRLNNFFTKTSV